MSGWTLLTFADRQLSLLQTTNPCRCEATGRLWAGMDYNFTMPLRTAKSARPTAFLTRNLFCSLSLCSSIVRWLKPSLSPISLAVNCLQISLRSTSSLAVSSFFFTEIRISSINIVLLRREEVKCTGASGAGVENNIFKIKIETFQGKLPETVRVFTFYF